MNIFNEINSVLKEKNIKIVLNESNVKKTFKEIGIDSLASMTVIIALEEKLKITIDDEVLMGIKTPADLIKIIEDLKK
ncbi:MAG: phosphopantetheine-binding protein [Mycoplasmoidaceae bacterium]